MCLLCCLNMTHFYFSDFHSKDRPKMKKTLLHWITTVLHKISPVVNKSN